MSDNLLKRYKKALEGLTVGGSEYYDEPEKCARDIREMLDYQRGVINDLIDWRYRVMGIPIIGWLVRKIVK